jgi:hypothetical protein
MREKGRWPSPPRSRSRPPATVCPLASPGGASPSRSARPSPEPRSSPRTRARSRWLGSPSRSSCCSSAPGSPRPQTPCAAASPAASSCPQHPCPPQPELPLSEQRQEARALDPTTCASRGGDGRRDELRERGEARLGVRRQRLLLARGDAYHAPQPTLDDDRRPDRRGDAPLSDVVSQRAGCIGIAVDPAGRPVSNTSVLTFFPPRGHRLPTEKRFPALATMVNVPTDS